MIDSIRGRISLFFSIIIIFSILFISIAFGIKSAQKLANAFQNNAIDLQESIYNHVITQHQSIIFHKENTLRNRKEELKTNVYLSLAIIESFYSEYKNGIYTLEEAQGKAISRIKGMRYRENVGYFWINDTGRPFPKMIMHPTLPDLDNQILDDPIFNCALGKDENLFKAFVDVTSQYEEGYVDYLWPKPTPEGLTEIQPKISFVKIFKPWNWIIGTGVYIDDIDKEEQHRLETVIEELNETIPKLTVGESGYFYIFNEQNDVLVHPNLKGENISDYMNIETGIPLTTELKNASRTESGSFTYLWDKPGFKNEYRFEKTSYVKYYDPLGWYIASSIYKDDLMKDVYSLIGFLVAMVAISILLIIFLSIAISRNITNPLFTLISFIKNTDDNGIPKDNVPLLKTDELNLLSKTINKMINTISVSHNKLRSIFDYSFKTIIIAFDNNGIITIFNSGAEKSLGYSGEEVVGKISLFKIYSEEEVDKRSKELSELYNRKIDGIETFIFNTRKEGYEEREWTYKKTNGEDILVNVIITPLRDNIDNITGYVSFAYDITETKRQEKEIIDKNRELKEHKNNLEKLVKERTKELEESLMKLKQTQAKLIESEKLASLAGLVAGVAHEINTPVGISVTAASHLEMKTKKFSELYSDGHISKQEFENYMKLCIESSEMILSNMSRASNLITSFKQIAAEPSSEDKATFKLKAYIDEILLSISSRFKDTSHKVSVSAESDFYINSYPGAIDQIIKNLVLNSFIHGFESVEKGTINIVISKENHSAIIKYRDSGRGISKENIEKIYEPFFTTKRGSKSSGLGLNIVYNIVTRTLEGEIICSSIENEYTEFIIRFPCNVS